MQSSVALCIPCIYISTVFHCQFCDALSTILTCDMEYGIAMCVCEIDTEACGQSNLYIFVLTVPSGTENLEWVPFTFFLRHRSPHTRDTSVSMYPGSCSRRLRSSRQISDILQHLCWHCGYCCTVAPTLHRSRWWGYWRNCWYYCRSLIAIIHLLTRFQWRSFLWSTNWWLRMNSAWYAGSVESWRRLWH